MECDREEELGEMYSPNESGEYTPHGNALNFTVQGLRDALNEAESTVTELPSLAEEFIIQLEVTMADRPGRLWLCIPILQMHFQSGSGDLHTSTWFPYCWKPVDNAREPRKKGADSELDLSRNLFCLCQ